MMLRTKTRKRGGAYTVEAAFVFPITFFLLLAIMIGTLGIFRFQECAYLARLGARFGSVRGLNYWNSTLMTATPGTAASTPS